MAHTFTTELRLAPHGLKRHPLSAKLPNMAKEDANVFLDDVGKSGVVDDYIVLYEGMVLDGWHRYMASEKHREGDSGRVHYREYTGDDPKGYVISKNIMRRHIGAQERVKAVLDIQNWKPGDPANVKETAGLAGASTTTVSRVQREQRAAAGVEPHAGGRPAAPPAPPADELSRDNSAEQQPTDFEAAMEGKPADPPPAPAPAPTPAPAAPAQTEQAPRQRSAKDVELDAERARRTAVEGRVTELEGELKFFRDQASPDEAARLSMLNAKDQEIRSLRSSLAEAQQQLGDVRNQLKVQTRKAQQYAAMLKERGVEVSSEPVGKA